MPSPSRPAWRRQQVERLKLSSEIARERQFPSRLGHQRAALRSVAFLCEHFFPIAREGTPVPELNRSSAGRGIGVPWRADIYESYLHMMRAPLLYLAGAGWARQAISRLGFARRAASRFVAGETPDEAIAAIRSLNSRGINATLD